MTESYIQYGAHIPSMICHVFFYLNMVTYVELWLNVTNYTMLISPKNEICVIQEYFLSCNISRSVLDELYIKLKMLEELFLKNNEGIPEQRKKENN